MKVRIAGYQLTYHPKTEWDKIYSTMKEEEGTRFKLKGYQRVLRVAKVGDDILGLLLTDRGHKNFLAIDTTTNEIGAWTLGAKKNFGAFNFFYLFKKKKTALITTYSDAGGPSFVFGAIERWCQTVLNASRVAELQKLAASDTAAHGEVADDHEGDALKWIEIVGREQFEAVLRRWKKIKAVEMKFLVASATPSLTPAGEDTLDGAHVRLPFKRGTTVVAAVDAVKRIVGMKTVSDAEVLKVDGVDEWGVPRRVELEDHIPSLFGELDHDAILADKTSFHTDLPDSFVIRHLHSVAGDTPRHFG